MLRSTFCLLRGVGESTEQRLWHRGIRTWADLRAVGEQLFPERKWRSLKEELEYAEAALAARALDFFLARLAGALRSRVLRQFQGDFAYLDIETEGLRATARVTSVALYDGAEVRVFVRGPHFAEAIGALCACRAFVTYNGATFDLPRLRGEFGLALAQPHLDLAPVMRGLGLGGGLKAVERRLGIGRCLSEGLDGQEAAALWARYSTEGDQAALHRLMAYNAEDAMALEPLLVHAYNESVSGFPLDMRCRAPGLSARRLVLESLFDN